MYIKVGAATARMFLGHSPDSYTLEQYYLSLLPTLDSMSILTDQPIEQGGFSREEMATWAPLALGKLPDLVMDMRNSALSQLIRSMILADPSAPDAAPNSSEVKNYRRRVKRYAEQILINQEAELQRQNITAKEMAERKSELASSKFANDIINHARELLDPTTGGIPMESVQTVEDGSAEELEDLFADKDMRHERDLEDILANEMMAPDADQAFSMSIDHTEADAERIGAMSGRDMPYDSLARSAMELWLDNSRSSYAIWAEQDQSCPLCEEDETASRAMKEKKYKSKTKRDDHMLRENFHRPEMKWRRRLEQHYKEEYTYTCPYCRDGEVEVMFKSTLFTLLVRHIKESSSDNTNEKHDELKAQDGWYETDWQDPTTIGPSIVTQEKKLQAGRKRMASAGIDTTPFRTIGGNKQVPGSSSLITGATLGLPLHPRYDSLITVGPPTMPDAHIPPHFSGTIGHGMNSQLLTNPIPDFMRNEIVMADISTLAEEMWQRNQATSEENDADEE